MADFKKFPILAETAHQYATEVLVLADAMGDAPVTLVEVMQDFLRIVQTPIIAGGFAVAHHGFVRGTVDIDVVAIDSRISEIESFKKLGYKHETVRISCGVIDLLSRSGKGVDFIHLDDDAFLKSLQLRTVAGLMLNQPVRVVSLEDLIIMKLIASRGRKGLKDQLDLEHLLVLEHDHVYVAKWKTHFKLED